MNRYEKIISYISWESCRFNRLVVSNFDEPIHNQLWSKWAMAMAVRKKVAKSGWGWGGVRVLLISWDVGKNAKKLARATAADWCMPTLHACTPIYYNVFIIFICVRTFVLDILCAMVKSSMMWLKIVRGSVSQITWDCKRGTLGVLKSPAAPSKKKRRLPTLALENLVAPCDSSPFLFCFDSHFPLG